MKIRISYANEQEVDDAIHSIEGDRAIGRTMCCAQIFEELKSAESRLAGLLPKKEPVRLWLAACSGRKPRAYKYSYHYTRATVTRTTTGWFLTEVRREIAYHNEDVRSSMLLTQAQATRVRGVLLAKLCNLGS